MKRLTLLFAALVGLLPIAVMAQDIPSTPDRTPTEADLFSSLFRSILNMPTIAVYVGIIVVVGPLIIGIINRSRWSSTTKLAVTVGACIVFSAGWFFANGDIIPVGKWVRLTLAIFFGATVMYKLIRPAVKEVEAATG